MSEFEWSSEDGCPPGRRSSSPASSLGVSDADLVGSCIAPEHESQLIIGVNCYNSRRKLSCRRRRAMKSSKGTNFRAVAHRSGDRGSNLEPLHKQ